LRDHTCAVESAPNDTSKSHLSSLVDAICACGVSFSVCQKMEMALLVVSMVGGEKKKSAPKSTRQI